MKKSSLGAGFLIGTVFGVFAGSIGGSVEPVPETRIHTVEVPKTTVHYETKTEYVVVPLPESCQIIVADLTKAVKQMNTWHNKAKDYYDQLENVDLATLDNQQANNQLVIRTDKMLDGEENALWTILELEDSVSGGVDICKAAIESAESSD